MKRRYKECVGADNCDTVQVRVRQIADLLKDYVTLTHELTERLSKVIDSSLKAQPNGEARQLINILEKLAWIWPQMYAKLYDKNFETIFRPVLGMMNRYFREKARKTDKEKLTVKLEEDVDAYLSKFGFKVKNQM